MAKKLISRTQRRGLIILGATLAVFAAVVIAVFILHPAKAPSAPAKGTLDISGTIMCLPHKNTDGPQTMECAYGLKDEKGTYYGLRDTDPAYRNISGVPMNVHVRVSGEFKPETSDVYPTVGTIEVTKISR